MRLATWALAVLVLLGALAFVYFVWPTPYTYSNHYLTEPGFPTTETDVSYVMRKNRFTGEAEMSIDGGPWEDMEGGWRYWLRKP